MDDKAVFRPQQVILLYHVGVRSWLFISLGWGIAALALIGIARLPEKNLNLYFRDYYVIVSKVALGSAVALGFMVPLLAVTVWHVRLRRR
jgi:hypothetical protein